AAAASVHRLGGLAGTRAGARGAGDADRRQGIGGGPRSDWRADLGSVLSRPDVGGRVRTVRLVRDRRADERRLRAQLADVSAADRAIVDLALPYTMTGVPRLQALIDAVRYVVARGVP